MPTQTGDDPVLGLLPISVSANQFLSGTAFVVDEEDDGGPAGPYPITQVAFFVDGSTNGYFTINGTIEPEGQWIIASGSDLETILATVKYFGSSSPGSETVEVQGYDSVNGTWGPVASETAITTGSILPTVNVQNISVPENQPAAASSLITSITNPNNDNITEYAFYDSGSGNGHFTQSGTTEPDGQWITATSLASIQYIGGSSPGIETLYVKVYDATLGEWSAQSSLTATTTAPVGGTPTVNVQNISVAENQAVAVSGATSSFIKSLTYNSSDNIQIWFVDSSSDGHFLDGATTEPSGQYFYVTPSNLGTVQYVGGSSAGSNSLEVLIDDVTIGQYVVAYATATTTAPVSVAPTINVQNISVIENHAVAASSFITSTSYPSGDNIDYVFGDSGTNGHFTLNGISQPDGQEFTVTASELSEVQYVGGTSPGSETLVAAVYDATTGLESTIASLTATTTAPANVAPTVNVQNISVTENQSVAASSLITSTSYPNGDSIDYVLGDSGTNGHFTLNGTPVPDGQAFSVTAAELSSVQYVGGSSPGSETLLVAAYDATTGLESTVVSLTATTTAPSVHVAPTITAVSNVSVAEGQAITASSFVASVGNPSGDKITPTIYIYEDSGGGSGYFTLDGVRQADGQWFYPLATDTVQYVGGSSPGTDTLHVGLYDYTTNTYSIANTAISATTTATTYIAPTVTTVPTVSVPEGQAIAASSLVASITNPSGDLITPTIYIYDDEGGGSGYFTVNGVRQADGQWFYPLATDVVQYVGGSSPSTDTLEVGLYDYTTNSYSISSTAVSATTTLPTPTVYSDAVNIPIIALYQAALGRLPDPTGLQNWENIVLGGETITEIAGGFTNSTEFQAKYGDLSPTAFVTLLYENVLDRAPDPSGLANWTTYLTTGAMTQAQVLVGFAESTENLANYSGTNFVFNATGTDITITGDGTKILFAPTAGNNAITGGPGVDTLVFTGDYSNYTLTQNSDGSVTVTGAGVSDNITNVGYLQFTDQTVVAVDSNDTLIAALYQAALDRAPDVSGIKNWESIYVDDVPTAIKAEGPITALGQYVPSGYGASIAAGFIQSAEFQSTYGNLDANGFITLLYENILGRAPDPAGLANWTGELTSGAMTEAMVLVGIADSTENLAKYAGHSILIG